jgi:hypothetical protein
MRKRHHRAGDVLAMESEAYLDGTLAEHWEKRGTSVPVWSWTNLLAHGSETQIADSVHRPAHPRRTGRSWRIARAFLAFEVLDLVSDEFTLADLQAKVLIPLELALSGHSEVERWTPRRWIDTVDHAIRNQHSTLGF